MLEHTFEFPLCCGPSSMKHQLLRGCPPDDPVDLTSGSHKIYFLVHVLLVKQAFIKDAMAAVFSNKLTELSHFVMN